jgi:hypothetical protein
MQLLAPANMLVFVALVFFFASIFSIGFITLLTYVKVIRIKKPSDFIIWGIVGGILITFIFVTLMCNKSSSEHIGVTSNKLLVTGTSMKHATCNL